jgi:glyoxylase-like metal-dependent hydrolase (beta-lactamase superfamily II)
VDGAGEILPGLRVTLCNGHTPAQHLVHWRSGNQDYVLIADLAPTTAHFHMPWIMAYDLYPLDTLKEKRELLKQAAADNWILWLYHEPRNFLVRPLFDGKRFRVGESFTL